MMRLCICLVAASLLAAPHTAVIAQTAPAPATAAASDGAKPSRIKLTMAKLKEMKAKWVANKPKLKACRKEMKAKGLVGDDRWFFIADCMGKE